MTSTSPAAPADGLRAGQVALTRQRILDAVIEFLASDHPAGLSIPEISRRSGVSVATIYRHFPDKEHLLDAVAQVGGRSPEYVLAEDLDPSDISAFLEDTYRHLDTIEPVIRAQVGTRLGAAVRQRRTANRHEVTLDVLEPHGFDRTHPATRRLARLTSLLASSPVYLDQLQQPREQVIADLSWAVAALADATRHILAADERPADGGQPT